MKNIFCCLFVVFIGFFLPVFAESQTTGFTILQLVNNAQIVARGTATSAIATNSDGMWMNPATIHLLPQSSVTFSHNEYIFDLSVESASISFKKPKSSFGFGCVYLNYGKEDQTDDSAMGIGEFHPIDIVAVANYSRRINPLLTMGVNGKLIYEKIDNDETVGFAGDIGMVYDTPITHLNISTVLQNIGFSTKLYKERIDFPFTFLFGTAYSVPLSNRNTLECTADVVARKNENIAGHFGVQYDLAKLFQLRAGYKLNYDEEDFSAGFGISLHKYSVDYSITPYNHNLGNAHRLSITYNF